jgi:uncharacterized protein (TIRG00374 family)
MLTLCASKGGRMSGMKRWQFWVGVGISALFLYRVLYKVDFNKLWQDLLSANYWWILPGIAVYFVGVWVRAWRWHYLLRPLKAVSTRKIFPIVTMGYAGNNIYPARAGELLRAIVLKRVEDVSISASLATIIVERVYDGVVMLAFVFLNLPELARLTEDVKIAGNFTIQDIAIWGAVFFVGALLVFLLAAMFPVQAEKVVAWLVDHFLPVKLRSRVMDFSRRFLGGLESLRSPQEALMIFLTTVVIWLLETVKYWFVMYAFKFEVSFFTLMLMNGVVNLATTIPSAPGYVGTFDLPGIAVLEAYGIRTEIATSYTFVLHFALWLPITILGLYYMTRAGVKWSADMEKMRHSE